MTSEEIKGRVEGVFRDVLDIPDLVLSRDTTADQVEGWDSLSHISLIAAVEREFKVKFNLREIKALNHVGDLLDLVRTKVA
jgi:acyl carrier protein